MIFSKTDIKLFDAFCIVAEQSSSIKEISFSNISKVAQISRQAIYQSYYKSLDELVNALHFFVYHVIKKACLRYFKKQKNPTSEKILSFIIDDILPLLYEKRTYLKVLYGPKGDPSWQSFIINQYTDLFSQLEPLKKLDQFQLEIFIRYIISVIATWMVSYSDDSYLDFSNKFKLAMAASPLSMIDVTNSSNA